ncbi:MAG: hypothetical protein OEW15_05750 [Nitrospirota bacterium]|nr:hypothetical protein [Nitrospirota bacterium]
MADQQARRGFFRRITSRDEALRTIRHSSLAFFIVALLQGGIGLYLSPAMLTDAALFGVLGFILYRWQSRVAASLLVVLSLLACIVTVLNRLGVMAEGGTNLVLAVIILWIAVRAAEAAFKLQGRFKESEQGLEE